MRKAGVALIQICFFHRLAVCSVYRCVSCVSIVAEVKVKGGFRGRYHSGFTDFSQGGNATHKGQHRRKCKGACGRMC